MKLTQRQVQHLLWRAAFFDSFSNVKKYRGKTAQEIFIDVSGKEAEFREINVLNKNTLNYMKVKDLPAEKRMELQKKSREAILELNNLWVDEMVLGENPFQERMALFWHDHFACRSNNVFFMQSYLNALRKYGTGSFRDLLFAIAKEPAMLQYLNNQQNRKDSPNENFAREVMELFTLGRGHYTEDDIKNAARAFTGWSFNAQGKFILRKGLHDFEKKEIFGQKGNFEGEEVLNMLLDNKQTALHITEKIYTHFVNDTPDGERVNALAEEFYKSSYDIKHLMKLIFLSEWFYDNKNIGIKIKSPIDLVVGLRKSLHFQFKNPRASIFLQRQLGQTLFDPPNVAGWPGGQSWIDSSTLLLRSRLAEVIMFSSDLDLKNKDNGDDNDTFNMKGRFNNLKSEVDTVALKKDYKKLRKGGFEQLETYLIQSETGFSSTSIDLGSNIPVVGLIIALTKLPDFQLC